MDITNTTKDLLFTTAEVAARAYEDVYNKYNASKDDVAAAKKVMDDAVADYNAKVTAEVQAECLAAEKPFLHALKRGYQDRLVVKVKVDSNTGYTSFEVEVDEDRDYIDINLLAKSADAPDTNWRRFIPTFNRLVTYAIGRALNDNVDADVAKLVKANKRQRADMVGVGSANLWDVANISFDADPLSVGSLKKAAQALAVMLLADDAPSINGSDIRMIIIFGTKEGKKNKYRKPTDDTTQKLLQKALHVRLNGLHYEEETK